MNDTEEFKRLEEDRLKSAHWRRWGPYVSERQWGTVREDYSASGEAWDYFPHDHARSRAYRWGEDGIAGISDNHQRLCFAPAFWNGQDPILKERLFGLAGPEGNHGEDVKEYYFYLDNTPTHAYMKFLYKYPQSAFPYGRLVEENRRRGREAPEFELADTGIFDGDRYFDVFVEYAKQSPDDILIRITAINRGPETKPLHVLPTLWFRNTWSWDSVGKKPLLRRLKARKGMAVVEAEHATLGRNRLLCEGSPDLLFAENETNFKRLYGTENVSSSAKDGIGELVIHGRKEAVNPDGMGTKVSAHYLRQIGPGETHTIRLRLTASQSGDDAFGPGFDAIFASRQAEADDFYRSVVPDTLSADMRNIQRQAFAGLLWTKQYYHFEVNRWLEGDAAQPAVAPGRKRARNGDWIHLYSEDILSMPDKWEYPWFAAWDLAFHTIPFAMVDPEFAKKQLVLLTREWYMHPNGQIPAYEWAFNDVNPPVHAWAAWRVYKIEQRMYGRADRLFLERVFQKLLLNFTWWINRLDAEGHNVFQGGFLGLDNIGVFDRSKPLPTGGHLEQSDGTAWMGMFCLDMLTIALELAQENPAYEDIASKFFEHFLYIADAINREVDGHPGLWDDVDGFYYDLIHLPDGRRVPIKIRSLVGLLPILAVTVLEPEVLDKLPGFKRRMEWFIRNRPDLAGNVASLEAPGIGERRLLSIVAPEKLKRILEKMLNPATLLGDFGIRSLSKIHAGSPYVFAMDGIMERVAYEPGESSTGLFGGNSNWRGPVWFPINYLLIESLQKFHHYLGDEYRVECPTGSGRMATLWEAATDLSHRLMALFMQDASGRRPVFGTRNLFQQDPHWRDYVPFHEYFHGDSGAGLGASHQTGWTALVAKLIQQCGEYCGRHQGP